MSGSGDSSSEDDCTYPFESRDYTIVAAITSSLGFVSSLACFFVIGIIVLYKKYLFFTQRLILYLAIAALLNSLSLMLQIVTRFTPNGFCIFSAFLTQLASWSELVAVVCIIVNILAVAFQRQTEKLEGLYLLLIFVLPVTFNWIPFIKDGYGKSGAWCWIRPYKDDCSRFGYGIILQALLWYVPLYIVLTTMIVFYVIIVVKLKWDSGCWKAPYSHDAKRRKEQIMNEVKPLFWFPIVYFVNSIFLLTIRLQVATSSEPTLAVWIIAALTYPLQGGFMAVIFTLDPQTFKRLKWMEFKATVMQLWKEDVAEYEMTEEFGDSYRYGRKRVIVKDTAMDNGYIAMKDVGLSDSSV